MSYSRVDLIIKIITKINWINGKLAAIESGHKEYLQLKEKGNK